VPRTERAMYLCGEASERILEATCANGRRTRERRVHVYQFQSFPKTLDRINKTASLIKPEDKTIYTQTLLYLDETIGDRWSRTMF